MLSDVIHICNKINGFKAGKSMGSSKSQVVVHGCICYLEFLTPSADDPVPEYLFMEQTLNLPTSSLGLMG